MTAEQEALKAAAHRFAANVLRRTGAALEARHIPTPPPTSSTTTTTEQAG